MNFFFQKPPCFLEEKNALALQGDKRKGRQNLEIPQVFISESRWIEESG